MLTSSSTVASAFAIRSRPRLTPGDPLGTYPQRRLVRMRSCHQVGNNSRTAPTSALQYRHSWSVNGSSGPCLQDRCSMKSADRTSVRFVGSFPDASHSAFVLSPKEAHSSKLPFAL